MAISGPVNLLLQLSLASSALAGVVSMSIAKKPPTPADITPRHLVSRATVLEKLYNNRQQGAYFANITVGTPAQEISVILDTGSSDLWMLSPTTDLCVDEDVQYSVGQECYGGTFDHTKSSTYKRLIKDGFEIQYVDESGSEGDYFSDTVSFGGNNSITGLQMGLAYTSTVNVGIMGIGYTENEAAKTLYPNIVDEMVSQGLINTRAYSLWLDEASSTTGQILFGGIDTAKFSGVLSILPLQPRHTSTINSFTVAMTGLSVGTPGKLTTLTTSTFALPVLLDSGTTLTYLPGSLVDAIVEAIGAVDDTSYSGSILADCSIRESNPDFVLAYRFGSASGPVINVPLREVIFDIPAAYQDLFDTEWDSVCYLGIMSSGFSTSAVYLLGDSFLRSAYVVYDIDNDEVAIAQTNFNSGSNAIVEIEKGGGIPNATGVPDEVTVTASATGRPGVEGGLGSGHTASIRGTATSASGNAKVTTVSGTVMVTSEGAPTGGAAPAGEAAPTNSEGAAAAGLQTWGGRGALVVMAMSFGLAAVGGLFVVL